MSMAAGLVLIGIGPGGTAGMTRAAIEAAKNSDHRRYEAYTALWSDDHLAELESEIGHIQKQSSFYFQALSCQATIKNNIVVHLI